MESASRVKTARQRRIEASAPLRAQARLKGPMVCGLRIIGRRAACTVNFASSILLMRAGP